MKKDKEFKNIKYILTSTMRTKLIISVYEKAKNLEELRNELNKPSATILHGLKELENLNFVKKSNKYYSLTSNGYLLSVNMIKLIENWYAINRNQIFWNNHLLDQIPDKLLKKLYLLKDSKCINSTNNDLSKPLTTYINLISKSKNLKIILPIFSEIHLNTLINLLKNKELESLELITTVEILESMKENVNFKKLVSKNKKIKIISLNSSTNLFLTCSDDYITMNLFFKDGHYDDSQLLIDKSDNGIKWGKLLFDHFKFSDDSKIIL